MDWDLFISHASEDKDDVARPLADRFLELGLSVWYDEYTLTVGDSLRRSIDRGLAGCRYGLVILSPHFLQKEWTQKELDGLVAREDGSAKRILPVWHNVSRGDIVAFSPPLADKLGVSTAKGLDHVVREIMRVCQSAGASVGSSPTKKPTTSIPKKKKSKETRKTQRTKSSDGSNSKAVATDSGRWVLLGTRFIEANFVRQNKDQTITVELLSKTAEEDAAMSALQPHHFGRTKPIPFGYGNDAWLVTVKEMEAVSKGKGQVWTLTLVPEKLEYGGNIMESSLSTGGRNYSADDFARMRAGRILLNDPPPLDENARPSSNQALMEGAFLESHIQGMNTPASVTHCVLQAVYKDCKEPPSLFLKLARLGAIYFLKAGGVVELVQELALGPIVKGLVHVKFRGVRRRKFSNVEPTVIEIEGTCLLQ
jgi:hypothetical protein